MATRSDGAIEKLLVGPVLGTREGCRRRVALLTIAERWAIAYRLGLTTAEGEVLARALHRNQRTSRT